MAGITRYAYRIAANELDFERRPTLASITDHVLDAAGDDADSKEFGVRDLGKKNRTWVLSRLCLELENYPEGYGTLRIDTWVSDVSRMMTTRNFLIHNRKGKRIGAASSNWAIIDMATRRPIDLLDNCPEYQAFVVQEPSPIAQPRRISALADHAARIEHRVAYSDLDFNCHTNTLRYLELMVDMLPLEKFSRRTPLRMDINFMHESRHGDLLEVAMNPGPPIHFEITSGGRTVCRALMEW